MGFVFAFVALLFACFANGVISHTEKTISFFEPVSSSENPELSFDVHLHAEDPSLLEDKFRAVSDPKNVQFGRHLSLQSICKLVEPASTSFSAVTALFRGCLGCVLSHPFACNNVVRVRGQRSVLEKILGAISLFRSRLESSVEVWALERNPTHLPRDIKLIHGLHLPVVLQRRQKTTLATGASTSYATATPQLLKQLYNVSIVLNGTSPASQGVAGWEHQSFSVGDLHHFQREYSLASQNIRKVYGHNTGVAHMESNLDTQYITAMGAVPTDFFLNSGFSFDVLNWAQQVANETSPALVWSLSYGEDLSLKSVSYAQTTNQVVQQMALRGISVLVASGDTGAYSRTDPDHFAAEFPGCLPAVTGVGATVLNKNLTETSAVSCDYGWCSGGGLVSPTYFPASTAPWQIPFVQKYLATAPNLPNISNYASFIGGVAWPTISTVGTNHDIYYFGFKTSVAGTSASCPSAAGMISLLNHARMSNNKSSIGFFNQIVYQNPSFFRDITEGTTPWPATVSFDLASGMGSPLFNELLQYVMSLP